MHQYDIRDLRIHFPTRRGVVEAVRGVSFYMDQGECVALVGESGCGKSVTARSLMGLTEVTGASAVPLPSSRSLRAPADAVSPAVRSSATGRTSSITAKSSGKAIGAGRPP